MLDIAVRVLHLHAEVDELVRRREGCKPPHGHGVMLPASVCRRAMQADEGADLDFLRGCQDAAIRRNAAGGAAAMPTASRYAAFRPPFTPCADFVTSSRRIN